jgi:nucleoside-diphosphate-sugar epimerase
MPTASPLTCAVTGANGYVGSIIASSLRHASQKVVGLCRPASRLDADSTLPVRNFSLDADVTADTFCDIDTLIHCAYDFHSRSRSEIWRLNVDGTIRLFDAARSAGVKKIVFISSISAFHGCKSLYGQAKLAVEQTAHDFGLTIVRPGLVYGPRPRGMMGSLLKLCSTPFALPTPGLGDQILYLAHEEDLGQLIVNLIESGGNRLPVEDAGHSAIIAANEYPKTLKQILQLFIQARENKRKLFIPVPSIAIWAGLRTLELLGVHSRFRSDSLVSLLNQQEKPDFSALHRLGVTFRPFEAASLTELQPISKDV